VRQALELLSDEPAGAPGPAAATEDGPVPSAVAADAPGALRTGGRDDEADTTPLPVILPGMTAIPRPEALDTTRGPFEPARAVPSENVAGSAPANTAGPAPANTAGPAPANTAGPAPANTAGTAPANTAGTAPANTAGSAPANTAAPELGEAAQPAETESADKLPTAASEKLDQIKDLLITAEAIGEANLDRHFDQVSQRQRELIREFFETARPPESEA